MDVESSTNSVIDAHRLTRHPVIVIAFCVLFVLLAPWVGMLGLHNLGSLYENRDRYDVAQEMNKSALEMGSVLILPAQWRTRLERAIEREQAALQLIDRKLVARIVARESFSAQGILQNVEEVSSVGANWRFENGGVFESEGGLGRWRAGASESLVLVDSGLADAEIEVTLTESSPNARLAFRYRDGSNGLFMESEPTRYQLFEINAGIPRLLASCMIIPTSGDRLALRVAGPSIRFAVNGAECARSWTTFNSNATLHGFGARDNRAGFDDWQVAVASPSRLWQKGRTKAS